MDRTWRTTAVRVASLATVAAVMAMGPGTTAAGAVEHPDPRTLARGADAGLPYLQDDKIHAKGRATPVEVPHDGERQVLLGRSGKDRLVASGKDGVISVHRIRRGRSPELVPQGRDDYKPTKNLGVLLSRGGTRLVWTEFPRYGSTTQVRRVSDGYLFEDDGEPEIFTSGLPFDAAGSRVLIEGSVDGEDGGETGGTAVWRPGVDLRVVHYRGISGGFITRDVMFLEQGWRRYGPTSISDPGTPAWSDRFTPLDLAPNGRRVLGVATTQLRGRDVLQVRRMRDGKVLRSWTFGRAAVMGEPAFGQEQTARFETDARVVFEVSRAGRSALVRCRVRGECRRASRLGGPISFGRERFVWTS